MIFYARKYSLCTLILAATSLLLGACNKDDYDTGDGDLSYLFAEMCDITAKNGLVTGIVNDADISLPFKAGLYLEGCTTDTTIRRMLYYTRSNSEEPIKIRKADPVTVIESADTISIDKDCTIDSYWISKNLKYLNLLTSKPTGKDGLYTTQSYISSAFPQGKDTIRVKIGENICEFHK